MPTIISLSDIPNVDDLGEELEQGFMDEDRYPGKGKKGGGGNGSNELGRKTFRNIRTEEVANSQEKRREEAEKGLNYDLTKHFPIDKSLEVTDKNIAKYAAWVVVSLENKYAVYRDEDLEFKPQRGHGPGGQNRNKVANGIRCKHLITGLFAVSDDETRTPVNKQDAIAKVLNKLNAQIRNWKIVLKGISAEELEATIKNFVRKTLQEKQP